MRLCSHKYKRTAIVDGKRVLIVGGGTGIGRCLAEKASISGAEVIIASRKAAQYKSDFPDFKCLSVDITIESEVSDLFGQVGEFDHLAVTVKSPLIVDNFKNLATQDTRSAFETKFWGQYNLAKHAYRYLREGGSITLTSGTLGQKPFSGFSTMSIIAGAIDSLSKSLALEFSPIRVNTVCPGFKTLKEMETKIPLGLGSSEQMANPYLYLMNDDYITGTTLVTDGGALIS